MLAGGLHYGANAHTLQRSARLLAMWNQIQLDQDRSSWFRGDQNSRSEDTEDESTQNSANGRPAIIEDIAKVR